MSDLFNVFKAVTSKKVKKKKRPPSTKFGGKD